MKHVINNLFILLLSLGSALIIPFYFHELLLFSVVKVGLGWVMSTILIRVLVILFFLFALNAILLLVRKGKRTPVLILIAIGIAPGFLVSFAIEPIYDIDYFMLGDDLQLTEFDRLEEASSNSYIRQDTTEVLAFFDVGCDHCQAACKKLGTNIAAGQTIPVHAFFVNDSANVNHFLENYNGMAFDTHYLTSENSFVSFAGYEFPSVFLIDSEGKTAYHCVGERINYSALDYLLRREK